jgi:hypothetical protein
MTPAWHERPEPELTEPPPTVTIRPGDGRVQPL